MAFLFGMTSMVSAQQTAEKLNRAPVAVKTAKGILVSWRSLNTDAASTSFSVYRNGTQIASAISTKTNYLDADGKPGDTYRIVASTGEEASATAWSSMYTTIDLPRPNARKSFAGKTTGRYRPDDISVGDVDGDGKVTAKDARLALRASAQIEKLYATPFDAADVNGDGKITVFDAQLLMEQAHGILADAGVRADESAQQIGAMADQIAAQLMQLQQAVIASKTVMQETAMAMFAINPKE